MDAAKLAGVLGAYTGARSAQVWATLGTICYRVAGVRPDRDGQPVIELVFATDPGRDGD